MDYLESSFATMEPADLLQWVQAARKTGVCRFQHGPATRRVYFDQGRITACTANEPHLLLGQFLIANGRIDAITLRKCMKLQEESGQPLGSLLISVGEISESELKRLVIAKAEETIYGLFDWREATFRFEPEHGPPADAMRIDLDVQAVLLEGARRRDEMDRARRVFHSPHVVLHRTARPPDPPTIASYMGRQLYESINGQRTMAQIILMCRVSEYLAYSFLERLVQCGFVHVGDAREPGTEDEHVYSGNVVNELQQLVAHGEYGDALDLIDRAALRRDGEDLQSMLVAKAEAGFLAAAYRAQLPPDSVPLRVCGSELPTLPEELSSEELLLLDLIEGKWDVRSLVWVAPMRKVDVVRRLISLRSKGHIELRPKASMACASSGGRGTDVSVDQAVDGLLSIRT